MAERLQKVMAEYGVASRRKSEEMIYAGKVKVNGRLVTEPGLKIDKDRDVIEVDGNIIKSPEKKIYILLNKPSGYITSVKDQFGRPTVLDLLKGISTRVFPIGRLDYDTEGLLILSNDGELTYRITHPKHSIDKTYRALVRGEVKGEDIKIFERGMAIEDYITAPAKMEIVRYSKGNSVIDITIHEGRNRQVRKMCSAIGHEVIRLRRIKIGDIGLGGLKTGEWRYLKDSEIRYLKELGGM
ncbi:MAG TPA: pseudouridine synthase [Bacillota bacterium]|jgi:23S rRNA pseudouridine2605 synthase|nr:pseudouridine synthase [Bacillota bacterium]HQI16837.1 pseudouridine synthase [Bacillota bacterium]HQJ36228.1 pseudouridine synthase [Bacillota bacterium]HRU41229.1 pseudouridine synthase [Candidatus Diapherotrites archaeon]